jgi:phytoene dehydrogenase-like protein
MPLRPEYDAVIVGAGPNGLAAAITLGRAGRSVLVIEARETPGGGSRSAELTLPGFIHDVCSAIHPLGLASPFFRLLPLQDYGLEWIHPQAPLAHPLDGGTAAVLERSLIETGASLGEDAEAYRRLMEPLAADWEKILDDILGPFPLPPRHLLATTRFGLLALQSASGLIERHFKSEPGRGLFAGMSAHSFLSLKRPISASFGLVLGMLGHAVGWPVARGGSQKIIDALVAYLRSLGGEIVLGQPVTSMSDLPQAGAVLFDLTPRQLLKILDDRLPPGYRSRLEKFRYGPGVFKIDYALDGPIPWRALGCTRAGTVHIGGTFEEVEASEAAVWRGEHPERPFVLLAQQSLFDPSRAPEGKQVAWAYCHVPNGSTVDMTERIEAQIERFAPGFRDLILARSIRNPADLQSYNNNYIGGDINGGVQDIWQLFTRPVPRLVPYSTPLKGVYICSSSTPPGGGVHGMCGFQAARAILRRV